MQGRNGDIVMRKVIEYFWLLEMEGSVMQVLWFFVLNGIVGEVDIFDVSSFHVMAKI